ncbi:hypothetical protein J2X69_000031 [Algoriphagus sp. 4150]|uniref:DUF6520 family protein n=1 Tax=Algoriphagus sp. 4150 TaxID=2817756 RepID=UPI0028641B44|nr:DUF6520 family protein [Algoriphagus sp. 4150]MDR7127703.1 hypothetical protein [Algoriphagus sp. 4150]
MKKLEGKLPLIAFVVAAFAAVAFTGPKEDEQQERWAIIDGEFENVTQAVANGQYDCDSAPDGYCLYDAENGNPVSPIRTMYVPL